MIGNGRAITEVSIRSNPEYLERIRKVIDCLSDHAGMDSRECYDTKLAITEACANAIRHGSPNHLSDRVTIRLSSTSGTLVAEVTDLGDGFDPGGTLKSELLEPGGFGIPLMKALTDEVEFVKNGGGTTVRLVKRARRPRRPRCAKKLR